jgi:hypothetical protein
VPHREERAIVDYKFRRKPRGTHCAQGHEFTEENTFTRAYDNARVCRECRKQYAREKYQRNKEKNGGVARVKKDKQPIFEIFESSKISVNAQREWNELQYELEGVTTPCMIAGPDKYVDNPQGISEEEAREMCSKCPLVFECYEFAVANDEKWGIWGGVNFTEIEETLFEIE